MTIKGSGLGSIYVIETTMKLCIDETIFSIEFIFAWNFYWVVGNAPSFKIYRDVLCQTKEY